MEDSDFGGPQSATKRRSCGPLLFVIEDATLRAYSAALRSSTY